MQVFFFQKVMTLVAHFLRIFAGLRGKRIFPDAAGKAEKSSGFSGILSLRKTLLCLFRFCVHNLNLFALHTVAAYGINNYIY
jgi:hypothetical protein